MQKQHKRSLDITPKSGAGAAAANGGSISCGRCIKKTKKQQVLEKAIGKIAMHF